MFNPVIIHSANDRDEKTGLYLLEIECWFSNFNIQQPIIHENNGSTKIMFPAEARLRNFSYSSNTTIDIHIKTKIRTGENLENLEVKQKKMSKIHIGKIPIMLRSCICILTQHKMLNSEITKECRCDTGGYFIINGSEKVVIGQERAAENNIMCFNIKKNNSKWNWIAEIKSVPDFKCISPKQINMVIASKNNGFGYPIYINIPRIKQPIPIFILFRAYGIISDLDICKIIILNVNDPQMKQMLFSLKASIIEVGNYITQEQALNYITNSVMYTPINMTKEEGNKKKLEFTKKVLREDLFPHCKTKKQKSMFLGFMINKLLRTSFGWRKTDDRDSYMNKRIDLVGTLLNNLYRNYFNKVVKDMTKQIIREINTGSWKSTNDLNNIINYTNVYKIVKPTTIENGLKKALATGDFGIKNTNSNKVGVAQVLNRLTYISTLSHLRRVNTPIDKSGKLIPPRKLHNTGWGMICPAESPEGPSVGVVKNLSFMTLITIRSHTQPILDVIQDKYTPLDKLTPEELYGKVKIILNGCWIGIVGKAMDFYNYLKQKKYESIINIYTSIVFDYKNKEIIICNDAGRLVRPVLKIKNNEFHINKHLFNKIMNLNADWMDLLVTQNMESATENNNSIIEYIDNAEQNTSMISMNVSMLRSKNKYTKHTHCEIHPSTIFGILASCIPFPEHNQSPRNTYQCAMGKQAMGMYVTNFKSRMDKTAYVQTYTSRPLVDTRVMNFIKLQKVPSGTNVIVAIMSYSGYNQEDSILINRGSLERGLFSATIYHTEKDEDKAIQGDEEIRCKADKTKTKGIKMGNYSKLDESTGVIPENTLLENNDILMGKVVPINANRNDPTKVIKYQDQSRIFRTNEECYVDKNYINTNGDGYIFCKTKTRTYRIPQIGDKFSSRHGQKGTCGNVLESCDMPTTKDGLLPDIIINPHAIPSRMTIAQLKETLLGKVVLELGLFGDGTSFGNLTIKEIREKLLRVGYEWNSNEVLYNGYTGEQMKCDIFMGPAFYQRLKHMVEDKAHCRSIGPAVVMTRQPAEGRSRDGGLRYGEMERDCIISHGASAFNNDRIYNCSDKYGVHVCRKCGMFAAYNDDENIHICNTCNNRTDFSHVKIPYACKLLFHELITMNIAPRIITEH